MSDLNSYVDRVKRKGDFRAESNMIQSMVGEIQQFVQDVAAADQAVRQIYNLERELRHNKDLEDDKRQEIEQQIREAREAEKMIDKQKAALRNLRNPISQLNAMISKII